MSVNSSFRLIPSDDKRKLRRVRVALPVKVRGANSDGIQFEELTRSIDINANGVLFLLQQDLKKGSRLKLSLPLPRSMQKTAVSKQVSETEGVVVRIEDSDMAGKRRVAVRFRGESAKTYYQETSSTGGDHGNE
jgi:hypothetical protein